MEPKNELSSSSSRLRRIALLFIDVARRKVSIDSHLLAGDGIQGEAGRRLLRYAWHLGDDEEVHRDQDDEHDGSDHEVAAHHEVRKTRDHVARSVISLGTIGQDQPRRPRR